MPAGDPNQSTYPSPRHTCAGGITGWEYGVDKWLLTRANTRSRKASTALGDPWPAKIPLPHLTQLTDCGDYEAELAVVIGRTAKNVSEADAMDYVLGYTAANDVSSRTSQFAQSQWCFSKGFDGSCPIGEFPGIPYLLAFCLLSGLEVLTHSFVCLSDCC